jgi:acyl carrier protein
LNEGEARVLVVEALHKAAGVLNDSAVSERLQNPGGDVMLDELGIDSLDVVEWTMEMEIRTGLVVDPGELAGAVTLSDVVQVIAAKLNAGAE